MDNEPIKIGRIKRGIEKALRYDLGEDVSVYVDEKCLRALAIAHPSDYLRRIEGSKEIISFPEYASVDKEGKTLFLIKDYFSKHRFIKMYAKIVFDKTWMLQEVEPLDEKTLSKIEEGGQLFRVGH